MTQPRSELLRLVGALIPALHDQIAKRQNEAERYMFTRENVPEFFNRYMMEAGVLQGLASALIAAREELLRDEQ